MESWSFAVRQAVEAVERLGSVGASNSGDSSSSEPFAIQGAAGNTSSPRLVLAESRESENLPRSLWDGEL